MGLARVTRIHHFDGVLGHLRKKYPVRMLSGVRRTLEWVSRSRRVQLEDWTYAGGSQWISMPREAAVDFLRWFDEGLFEHLRRAKIPDEIVFHTFAFNTHWRSRTTHGCLEPATGDTMEAYANFHYLRPSMTGTVNNADIDAAVANGDFFIRKVGQEQRDYIQSLRGAEPFE